MKVDLSGKPIAITGASSGIGAATALACARAGMPVMLGARREDRLRALAERIRAEGGRAETMGLDVRDPAQGRAFIDRTAEAFGAVYAVFANAGYGLECAVADMTDQQWRDIFEVNFFGTLHVVRPALERMLGQPRRYAPVRGHVLICSSCLAKMTLPRYGAYSATKAAQNHLGRALRLEVEGLDVAVSTVHPIGTRTEFFAQVKSRSGASSLAQHTPGWFMQTPEFVASRIVRCLRRPRPEVWTGLRGAVVRFGMAVNTLFPRLADVTARRAGRGGGGAGPAR
jgi:short-subunit dehydrogenase